MLKSVLNLISGYTKEFLLTMTESSFPVSFISHNFKIKKQLDILNDLIATLDSVFPL